MNLKLIGRIVAIILIVIYAILSINYIGFSYHAGEGLGSYVFWITYSTIANFTVVFIFTLLLEGLKKLSKILLIKPEFLDLNENYTALTREVDINLTFNLMLYWVFLFTIPLSFLVMCILKFPDNVTRNFVFIIHNLFLGLFILGRTFAINRYWRKDVTNNFLRSSQIQLVFDLPLFTIKTQLLIWFMQLLSFLLIVIFFLKLPQILNYDSSTFHIISIVSISDHSGKTYLATALVSIIVISFWIKEFLYDIFSYEKIDSFFEVNK